MNNEFSMTTGQAHEVAQAFGRNGWSNEQVKEASKGDFLKQVLDVLLGHAEITPINHVIDCDVPVFVPENWSVIPDTEQLPNRVRGVIALNPTKVNLHLADGQKNGKWIEGNKLHKELVKERVLTAHVLDYLLRQENQYLIPEEWKGKAVFFQGTVYRHSDGSLCVRCLNWGGGKWCWLYRWLGHGWFDNGPTAVLAS